MKKTALFVTLLATLFASCIKKDDDDTIYTPPYHVDGITDITVSENAPIGNMSLYVMYENSKQERVELSLEGLPAGLGHKIYNPSGYPTFNSQIQFYDSSAAVGNYQAKLVVKGAYTGRAEFPFNINVVPVPECASEWTGGYTASNFCTVGPSGFNEYISLSTTKANRIQINNFEDMGIQIYADLNCSTQRITVPSQTVGGYIYNGSGYFYTSGVNQFLRIEYNKTAIGGGGTSSCIENMSR